jgi:hypothetical protein
MDPLPDSLRARVITVRSESAAVHSFLIESDRHNTVPKNDLALQVKAKSTL